MLAKQRREKILELLNENGTVHTSELVDILSVSSETIRSDLDHLENEGQLARVHGGAVPVNKFSSDFKQGYIPLHIRNSQHLNEKSKIASYAIKFVKEGDIVALDYGSTSQIMAMELRENFKTLTVVTNSIQNAMILADNPNITVMLIGGILNRDEYTLVNNFSTVLSDIHIDTMFMTVTGIDPEIGCTDQRLNELKVQQQLHNCASKTIVLADSSKFGKASFLKICPIKDIDAIVTDSNISDEMAENIIKAGTNLHTA